MSSYVHSTVRLNRTCYLCIYMKLTLIVTVWLNPTFDLECGNIHYFVTPLPSPPLHTHSTATATTRPRPRPSPVCIADLYEGLHRLVARKERVHLSGQKKWSESVVPYAQCTIESLCHDQSALQRGRTF